MSDSDYYEYDVKRFVEDYHKMLSILGMFVALTVFSMTLKPQIISIVLSVIFFTSAIIIVNEISATCRINNYINYPRLKVLLLMIDLAKYSMQTFMLLHFRKYYYVIFILIAFDVYIRYINYVFMRVQGLIQQVYILSVPILILLILGTIALCYVYNSDIIDFLDKTY